MGTKHSRSVPQPATVWWNRYDELAAAIDAFHDPSAEQVEYISKCTLSALEPSDATKPPLLALAKEHDEWFRCLLKKCDPGVKWKQGGKNKSLEKELIGHRNFSDWCAAMEKWNEKREKTKTNDVVQRTNSWKNDERWWSEFGVVSLALGLSAAAVGTIGTGGTAVLGFPVVAVGHVIWTVIKKWYTTFEECGPSSNMKDIFSMHAEVVGSILKELNTRIETAEMAVQANPDDVRAEEESARQKIRVNALRALLEEDTEKMNSIVAGNRRASHRTKYDQMMSMLGSLLEFQRKLHTGRRELAMGIRGVKMPSVSIEERSKDADENTTELMEERMSDNLARAVSTLRNIEERLDRTIPVSHSNDSRIRSLYLDSSVSYARASERSPSTHRSTVCTVGVIDSPRGSEVSFCQKCRVTGGNFCPSCGASLNNKS